MNIIKYLNDKINKNKGQVNKCIKHNLFITWIKFKQNKNNKIKNLVIYKYFPKI